MATANRIRHPAVPIVAAFAVGIVPDRQLSVPETSWSTAAAAAAGAWLLASAWGRPGRSRANAAVDPRPDAARVARAAAAASLLIWIGCLGGARHHLFWSTAPADHISLFAREEGKLVRLTGVLADQPEIISPPKGQRSAWASSDSTAATLHCRQLDSNGSIVRVSGVAGLRVRGRLLDADVGDEIEICGWLLRPKPSRNPGAFDPAEFLRRQNVRCLVTADQPGAVRVLRRGSAFTIWRLAARVRARGEALFRNDLSPRTAPVATALLFGGRTQMEEEIREAFVRTGLLHILAISGMHVAILALLLWGIGRLFGLSIRGTSLMTIAGIVGYALLTDCRPPVIRAAVLVCLFASAQLWNRRPALLNGLAWAALGILTWNPSDLFDVGTQLSFLAVLGIVWAMSERRPEFERSDVRLLTSFDDDETRHGAVWSAAHTLWTRVRDEWRISVAAALFTMPLVAARFHLVSPIGILINVGLAPLSTLVLWLGYLHLGIGLVIPWASRLLAVPFDWGLWLLLYLVESAARVRLSYRFISGPPEWWLGGFYALLFAVTFLPALRRWGTRRWSLLAAWTILGLAWGLRPPSPDGLRCTFLAVGHGEAILLELPSGRTLLYDAGAIQDGRVAQQAVQSALWERRHAGLDAIVVSHADVDHFNGVAGLTETVPVGVLFVSQQFLDFGQPAVAAACETSSAQGVPIRLIRSGDRVRLDRDVEMTVLHPGFGPPQSDDNANSVVLLIEYAGRRILLTGDLERAGQTALLRQPRCATDVLLAPHHGSRKANPPALAAWARPKHVVVSAGPRVDYKSLRAAYGPAADIVCTQEAGAVTFEIRPDGSLLRTTVRPPYFASR